MTSTFISRACSVIWQSIIVFSTVLHVVCILLLLHSSHSRHIHRALFDTTEERKLGGGLVIRVLARHMLQVSCLFYCHPEHFLPMRTS